MEFEDGNFADDQLTVKTLKITCLEILYAYGNYEVNRFNQSFAIFVEWTLFIIRWCLLFYFVFRTCSIFFRTIYRLQMVLGV